MKRALALLALAAAAPACTQDGKSAVVVPPPPMTTNKVYEDLPLPEGFTYVENYSSQNPSGDWRTLTQSARGNRRVEGATKFYKEVFPRHGWTQEAGEIATAKEAKLAFTNKTERCAIEIKDESATSVFISVKVNKK